MRDDVDMRTMDILSFILITMTTLIVVATKLKSYKVDNIKSTEIRGYYEDDRICSKDIEACCYRTDLEGSCSLREGYLNSRQL